MVYINSRGEIVESKPIHGQIVGFFYGIFSIFLLFFKTLFEPFTNQGPNNSGNYRLGGNRNSGSNGGNGVKKRIGGFSSMGSSPSAPPCAGSS
ncbi:unnamed protein product [Brachionus calyciflorus]|uniref:Selenoprotein K n=1 Tax=Brachionus calyciflorus TaxID=104777 RepID=A0A813X8G6_9BILA|nr:unnamed protein product [Brachionus calyciflorus]